MDVLRIANECLHKNRVEKLPVTAKDVERAITSLGFDIFSYTQAKEFIELKHLQSKTVHNAFTIITSEARVVMYRDTLSSGEKTFSLAHELGHIVCGHVAHGIRGKAEDYSEDRQEQEADGFAYQYTAPLCVLKKCGVNSTDGIENHTVFGKDRSVHILGLLSGYSIDKRDEQIIKDFTPYINQHRKRWKFFALGGAAASAAALIVAALLFTGGKELPVAGGSSDAISSLLSTSHGQSTVTDSTTSNAVKTDVEQRPTPHPEDKTTTPATKRPVDTTQIPATFHTASQPLVTQTGQPTKPKLTEAIRQQITIEIKNIYQPQYDRLETIHEKYVDEQQQKLIDIDTDYEIAKMTIEQSGASAGYKQTQLANALNAQNQKTKEVKEDMAAEQKDYEKTISDLDKEVETLINRRLAEYEQ